ncbi:MAG TPA: heavy metal-binding domain-containing protein [Bacteroidia bacterium]
MKIIKQLFTVLFIATVFISCHTVSTPYQCPMKCEGEKIYNKPGACPVCKMDLEKVIQKSVSAKTNPSKNDVNIVGAMKNVMRKGELYATIDIDTIENKQHLFGLGPIEYLTGEIMLMDGKGYKSVVINDSTMQVTETFAVKAPFFGYATIESWKETEIPDSILTILSSLLISSCMAGSFSIK